MMGHQKSVTGTGMLSFIQLGTADPEPQEPVRNIVQTADVVVFTSMGCPYCSQAISVLNAKGIPFVDVPVSGALRKELYELTGATSVPSLWVKGTYIGGFNDGPEEWMGLAKVIRSGKLDDMLGGQ